MYNLHNHTFRCGHATGQDEDGNPYHDDGVMSRVIWAASLDMGKYKKYMAKDKNSRSKL